MDTLLKFLLIVAIYIFSAIMHEADLSRNYNETGDAKAWFFDIKRYQQPERRTP